MKFEQDDTFKEFGLNRKEADYIKNLLLNMTKQEAYQKAFGNENLDTCSTLASRLENKKGEQLEAYKKHLIKILQDETVVELKQMQLFLYDMMRDKEVSHKDRIRCCEDLVKMMGGFVDRQEIDAKVETVVFTGENDILE